MIGSDRISGSDREDSLDHNIDSNNLISNCCSKFTDGFLSLKVPVLAKAFSSIC